MNLYEFDEIYRPSADGFLCGVDEAGRGPLAGPVFAAAVILKPHPTIEGLNDSKKLTARRRELLYDEIIKHAVSYSIAFVDEKTIDRINILQATFVAMRAAVDGLKSKPSLALIDGNRDPHLDGMPTELVVKGDGKSASIAAASILAKVARDRAMLALAKEYPEYRFEQHKGYGTKLHYEMLKAYGISPVHRKSFLKKLDLTGVSTGPLGEAYTASFLQSEGYEILSRNYHSRYGEIDIVACKEDMILFVEVKTRTEDAMAEGRQAVDSKKRARIVKTALCYLDEHPSDRQPRFDVAEVVTRGADGKVVGFTYLDNAFMMEGDYATF